MKDKKTLKKAKNIFKALTTDSNSALFAQEKIGNRLLKNFKKSKQEKDSLPLKLIRPTDSNVNDEEYQLESIMSKKREIDQLYIVLTDHFN